MRGCRSGSKPLLLCLLRFLTAQLGNGEVAPYFFLAPGLGLGLLSAAGLELVEVSGSLANVRSVAAALTDLASGNPLAPDFPFRELALAAHARWQDLGGQIVVTDSRHSVPNDFTPEPFEFAHLHSTPLGPEQRDVSTLSDATQALAILGYEVVLRSPTSNPRSLSGYDFIPVYEVHKEDGSAGVIAEGKGLDDERSRASAVGEAVERILGSNPAETVEVITASAVELGSLALPSTELGLGPRDAFSDNLRTDWVHGYSPTGAAILVPAEMVFMSYVSRTGVVAVAHRNTTGLAAGTTRSHAFLNALMEVLERDAYWIVMRCRLQCSNIELDSTPGLPPYVKDIVAECARAGLRFHLKDISLDWPVHIVHALLANEQQQAPAFAHGTGAAFDLATAATRAVCEATQVHSDLRRLVGTELEQFILPEDRARSAALSWADPLWRPNVEHLMTSAVRDREQSVAPVRAYQSPNESLETSAFRLLRILVERGHRVICCPLGELGGIQAVRVLVTGATHPDPRIERVSARLRRYSGSSSRGIYGDPILT